ncbi:MarR family winged helix-turn-helix transcriptional regulator [Rugamonas sp. CCM 8940]|uniref:MarR family winged helix-turn-helix transcriptional regulator n=1 Tax=Rugamonas sp. CCM 8940 TaxID=2765359 RepID=UPI0018F647A7|nr:MarR family transcriptional regulator [Rugamonas sp. CCM 8940]MBJ7312794.1 MarR family transcriptional regulator [Rugamonas sp. CCM 8940]
MKPASSPHGTQTWLSAVRAYNLCEMVVGARLAAIDLRIGDLEVLATLATKPGLSQRELAARCFVTKSGVSMLLTQMAARDWVRREDDPADARAKRLFLTERGMALAARAMRVQAEVVTAMVTGSSPAEIAAVGVTMERVCARLEALRLADRRGA